MKKQKNKLDEAVKITSKGKVKVTIPGLVINKFSDAVWNKLEFLSYLCQEHPLDYKTARFYVDLAFVSTFHEKNFQHRQLPDNDYTFTLPRLEAYLLWEMMKETHYGFNHPLLESIAMKLHQKIA